MPTATAVSYYTDHCIVHTPPEGLSTAPSPFAPVLFRSLRTFRYTGWRVPSSTPLLLLKTDGPLVKDSMYDWRSRPARPLQPNPTCLLFGRILH